LEFGNQPRLANARFPCDEDNLPETVRCARQELLKDPKLERASYEDWAKRESLRGWRRQVNA
jgi:hypothetical protein